MELITTKLTRRWSEVRNERNGSGRVQRLVVLRLMALNCRILCGIRLSLLDERPNYTHNKTCNSRHDYIGNYTAPNISGSPTAEIIKGERKTTMNCHVCCKHKVQSIFL